MEVFNDSYFCNLWIVGFNLFLNFEIKFQPNKLDDDFSCFDKYGWFNSTFYFA